MNKIQIVKTTLHYAADFGGGFIVGGIVSANVPRTNIITKMCVPVAGFALGVAAGRIAAKETDRYVDEVVAIFDKYKKTDTVTV